MEVWEEEGVKHQVKLLDLVAQDPLLQPELQ
jgi:hypothetical protein